METELPAVHEALAAVLDGLGPIPKNGQAPGNMGGYPFRRVEDITAALKPLFAKHGVLCLPSVMNRIETERLTRSGGVMFCVDLEICFRFVGPQGDELAANVWGQGTDSGDKATQKAVTSAFKTMLSVVFCISDSTLDAEAHSVPETTRPAPAPKETIDALVDSIATLNLGDWVRDQGFAWPWTDAACRAIQDKVAAVTAFEPEPPLAKEVSTPAPAAELPAESPAEPAAAESSPDPTETAEEPTEAPQTADERLEASLLQSRFESEVAKLGTKELHDRLVAYGRSPNGTVKHQRESLVKALVRAETDI